MMLKLFPKWSKSKNMSENIPQLMRKQIENDYPKYTKNASCESHFEAICMALSFRPITFLFVDLCSEPLGGTLLDCFYSPGGTFGPIATLWGKMLIASLLPNSKIPKQQMGQTTRVHVFCVFYCLCSRAQSNGLMHKTVRLTKSERRIRTFRFIAKFSQPSRRVCVWFCEPPLWFGTWERNGFCL